MVLWFTQAGQEMSLARGAARGAAWSFVTVLAERSFGFLVLALLMRVVPLKDVGLIAIASAISDLARIVANSGAGEQVQANPGDSEVEAGAFWSQFVSVQPVQKSPGRPIVFTRFSLLPSDLAD